MKRVNAIGGIFFRSKDPKTLMSWYEKHLGIKPEKSTGPEYSAMFNWNTKDDPRHSGFTVWAIFPKDTKYFGPGRSQFMVNFRVNNLKRLLKQLKKERVRVEEKMEEYPYGKFGWITDPEGNRVELWEPTKPTRRSGGK